MRQINRCIVFLVGMIALITVGCTKKAPVCEKLEGFWRLERIYNLETGEVETCNRLFWAIQLGMIELRDLGDNGYGTYIGIYRYNEEAQTLELASFIQQTDQFTEAPLDKLIRFGVAERDVTYHVSKLKSGKMVLETADLKLEFTEF